MATEQRRYRKVQHAIWSTKEFLALPKDGKLAYLYIVTHPNMISMGLLKNTIQGIAAELQVSQSAVKKVVETDLVLYDKVGVFAIRDWFDLNTPESPNVVKSWRKLIDQIPECDLRDQQLEKARECTSNQTEGFGKTFAETFGKTYPKTYPNNENENENENENQNQNQNQNQNSLPPKSPKGDEGEDCSSNFEEEDGEDSDLKSKLSVAQQERFDKFWEAWPKRQKRSDAMRAWKLLNPNDELTGNIVREALCQRRDNPQWEREDGRFIPTPGNWLRNEGWLDETEVDAPIPSKDIQMHWKQRVCDLSRVLGLTKERFQEIKAKHIAPYGTNWSAMYDELKGMGAE